MQPRPPRQKGSWQHNGRHNFIKIAPLPLFIDIHFWVWEFSICGRMIPLFFSPRLNCIVRASATQDIWLLGVCFVPSFSIWNLFANHYLLHKLQELDINKLLCKFSNVCVFRTVKHELELTRCKRWNSVSAQWCWIHCPCSFVTSSDLFGTRRLNWQTRCRYVRWCYKRAPSGSDTLCLNGFDLVFKVCETARALCF